MTASGGGAPARVDRLHHAGLVFDVTDEGPLDGRVVVLLHGFPEDRRTWSALAPSLVGAGLRVLAPDQRGYSPGAAPAGRRAYRVGELVGDVLALADAAGAARVDVVGHDWGALVAWEAAARHPERVRSLCALSVPHPRAVRRALTSSAQLLRSSYVLWFQLPRLPELAFGIGAGRALARGLERSGLDAETAGRYGARAARRQAMTGPLNWYRALPFGVAELPGPVRVPTTFVWGARERFVTRSAAEHCGAWVEAPYRFVELPGATHWLPTTATAEVAAVLAEHLAAVAA